jgi:hypothetical protein
MTGKVAVPLVQAPSMKSVPLETTACVSFIAGGLPWTSSESWIASLAAAAADIPGPTGGRWADISVVEHY